MDKTYKVGEKAVERYLVVEVEKRGGECLKYTNANKAGYPDRLVMLPGGITAWAEVKGTGIRPRPLQIERFKRLRQLGQRVSVVDCYDAVDRLLLRLLEGGEK